ncbi:serine O-acetyltransferase [Candidatus Saganbacteria bacterium CG08_land_8_20_14_0_20_45_16]|uniref:Serine acetyltransferase n=1 Tax=Candidatus Saganbacteria bacterium CG08_land_8_20_14_0_20_45_16 TaxID=2014293 RepID=A0A2H0XXT0_UNCSA|nr:MAG: serine O-acetyltransferase [Candidatus Saganbacteria bacterium CG08_land_8_20_14_0_20_45_16]
MFNDIKVIFDKDPAARNIFEVFLYQGLWAIWFYRFSHLLYVLRIPVLPRLVSQIARLLTQIEIHPGAKIGQRFFIDHGVGVVIGETTVIGDDVMLYQGVTLGGTGKEKGRRHPTLGDNVVVGAGAIVLGAIVIGNNSRIGAGSVVTKSIPPDTTVVGNPCWIVRRDGRRLDPLEHGSLPDPVHKAIDELNSRIKALEEKIK